MQLQDWPGYVPGFPDTFNLRDLGGLPTADDRHVRHGLLYRSGPLVDLDTCYQRRVDELDLRFILDLRSPGECVDNSDYVPATCRYARIGGMRFANGDEVDFSPQGMARIERELSAYKEFPSLMTYLYQSMLFDNPAIHALVDAVVSSEVPVLFHCTAGKDRTGVAALVLGVLLGVTREAIFDDYLITNEYRRQIIENPPATFTDEEGEYSAKRWAEINGVQRRALEETFAALDERYSSEAAYLQAEFGLDADALAGLRDRYLE